MDFNNKNGFNFTFMYRFIKEEFRYASKIFFPILIPYFRGLPIHGFLRVISRSASISCKHPLPFSQYDSTGESYNSYISLT